ncbi:MAG TPA: DNA internalization-related competence protein ComEC/Rec2 [Peptococcaceae bacterium]|nr:MAG: DNA internalization-related competence protein ComEC/Rec2 [Clostridia bacterium 41_269]HBT20328.1 DNA internalization-related competence protein ComEC/Rec2 [Peptococcaceae bacterium]
MNRPLIWISLCFSIGIVLEKIFNFEAVYYFAAAAALTLCALIFFRLNRNAVFLIFALAAAAGALRLDLAEKEMVSHLIAFEREEVQLEGIVTGSPEINKDRALWHLKADRVGRENGEWFTIPRETVMVYYFFDGDEKNSLFIEPGRRIRIEGILNLPRERRNPGEFNYREYLSHRGIFALLYVEKGKDLLILDHKERGLSYYIADIKAEFKKFVASEIPKREAGLLLAVLFGDKEGVSREDREMFSSIGVAHTFAVSGLHVGFVLLFVISAAKILNFRNSFYVPIVLVSLFIYCVLSEFAVTVVRAAIMGSLALLGVYYGREKNSYLGLALSSIIILIWNPFFLFEPGFQLSYAVVISLLYFSPFIEDLLSFLPYNLNKATAVPIAAQLGTAPFTALHFNYFSLVSIAANILLIAVMGLVVLIGLLGFVLFFFFKPLAGVSLQGVGPLLKLFYSLSEIINSLPFSSINMASPALYHITAYFLILVGIKEFMENRENFLQYNLKNLGKSALFAGILIMFISAVFDIFAEKPLEVIFLDVGQGDSIFIETPSGRKILIDGGGKPEYYDDSSSPGRYVVVPFLKSRGVNRLDYIINTHPDADHAEGLFHVISAVKAEYIITPPVGMMKEEYGDLLKASKREGILHREFSRGMEIDFGDGVRINVLAPGKNRVYKGTNENSLVLKVIYGDTSFLLTGDIEGEGLFDLTALSSDFDSTVLKLPHHGSVNSFDQIFYNKADPEAVVISVGESNRFGHPSEKVVEYWNNLKIPLYRTDAHGAVIMKSDGKKCSINTIINENNKI